MPEAEIPLALHVLILLLIAAASAGAGYAVHRAFEQRLRSRPKRLDLIVVHTHKPDDRSIKGHFLEQGPHWMTLIEAEYMTAEQGWQAIPGQAVVPLASVSWIQKLAAE